MWRIEIAHKARTNDRRHILFSTIRLWERSEELVVLEEEEAKRREEEAKLALQSSEVNADQVIAGVNPDQEEATLAQVDIEQVPD